MACEKLCKARLIRAGTPPAALQESHGYITNPLPMIIRQQLESERRDLRSMRHVLRLVRHLAEEIEILSPAVRRGGRRPENCEYPWESGGVVYSPLDWSFPALRLCDVPAGRTILKLLRLAIDGLLLDLER